MKRTVVSILAAAVASLAVAGAASAASITVVADSASYAPGDTITLTITTDSQGDTMSSFYMATLFDTSVLNLSDGEGNPAVLNSQTLPSGFFGSPINNAPTSEAGGIQSSLSGGAFPAADPGTGISGITRLIVDGAAAPGVTTISFGGAGVGNDFGFGSASAPASINITIVPEPTTAALLGLGVLGLAISGRRRS